MCNEEHKKIKDCNCLSDILRKILLLQKQDFDNENFTGCDKPYLGPTCEAVCYNTRPIQLYNCCTGNPWVFPYTFNEAEGTSNVFRIESLDECCATLRVLRPDTGENRYAATRDFVTINLECVGALKCLSDTFIELC